MRNTCLSISTPIHDHREGARNRRWAEQAWNQVGRTDGACRHSEDYAQGFKDGFAEYLFRGGDGEPPLIAPLRYRHVKYQTAEGYAAIQDWFGGYRHGAGYARDSGARRFVVGPSALVSGQVVSEVPVMPPQLPEPAPLPQPRQVSAPSGQLPAPPRDEASVVPRRLDFGPPALDPNTIAVITTPEPASIPSPEPMRLKINGIRVEAANDSPEPTAAPPMPRLRITEVLESAENVRPRTTGMNAVPLLPEPGPTRIRITTITVAPPKE